KIKLQVLFRQSIENSFLQNCYAARSNVRLRRHSERLNALFRVSFDVAFHTLLARRDEKNRFAFASSAPRTTDAMNVNFRVARHIVIDNRCDLLDIQTSRG